MSVSIAVYGLHDKIYLDGLTPTWFCLIDLLTMIDLPMIKKSMTGHFKAELLLLHCFLCVRASCTCGFIPISDLMEGVLPLTNECIFR